MVELLINKKRVVIEVDTGASCLVISLKKIKELGQLQDLEKSSVKLTTYTGEMVRPQGTTNVEVSHEDRVSTIAGCEMGGTNTTWKELDEEVEAGLGMDVLFKK